MGDSINRTSLIIDVQLGKMKNEAALRSQFKSLVKSLDQDIKAAGGMGPYRESQGISGAKYGNDKQVYTNLKKTAQAKIALAAVDKKVNTDTEKENKRARVQKEKENRLANTANNKAMREEEAYLRSYEKLSNKTRRQQDAQTSAQRKFENSFYGKSQAARAKQDSAIATVSRYKQLKASGDYEGAGKMQGAAMMAMGNGGGNASGLTWGQRWKAGSQAANRGYGKYLLAGMLGGNAGLLGLAAQDSLVARGGAIGGKTGAIISGLGKGIGFGGMALGAAWQGIGLAKSAVGALGINKEMMQDYIDFDNALRLATLNLKAGVGSDEWGKTSQEIQTHQKRVSDKMKNASLLLSTQYGMAGSPTEMADLMRAMSGVGGLSTAQDVINLSGVAAQLSMVSEETSPEEAGRGIMAIYNAAKMVGIKNLGFKDIAASMYRAGALSPAMVSDLTSNASNIAVSMSAGSSLSEALASYMLATYAGYSPAKGSTQLASLQLRKGNVWSKKGYDKMFGISGQELQNLTFVDFVKKLNTQATKEKLATAYNVAGGVNPLTQKPVLNVIDQILQQDFGLRGGSLASIMSKPGGIETWEKFVNLLSDGTQNLDVFNGAVSDISGSLDNKIKSAGNSITGLKMTIWDVLAPWAGRIADNINVGASIIRTKNTPMTDKERSDAAIAQIRKLANIPTADSLYDSQMSQYAGSPLEPFINFGKLVSDIVDKLTKPGAIEGVIKGVMDAINLMIKAAWTLFEVIISIADWMANSFLFGDSNVAAQNDYAEYRWGNTPGKGQLQLGELEPGQKIQVGEAMQAAQWNPRGREMIMNGLDKQVDAWLSDTDATKKNTIATQSSTNAFLWLGLKLIGVIDKLPKGDGGGGKTGTDNDAQAPVKKDT
jgi:hypothetical protein